MTEHEIERYTPGQRSTHWIVAITFVLLALSGLALFHPGLFWLSNLFGGGTWTRILHPWIGLVMFVVFALLAVNMWRHNLMRPNDWAWLRRARDVIDNREDRLPEVGRYNAGQKLLYFVMLLSMIGLLLTGLVMWRQYFTAYFSIDVLRVASVLHAICATLLICGIIVHIYAAIWIKGSLGAMTHGKVSLGWAWKHHRAWFREVVHSRGEASPHSTPAPRAPGS